MSVKTFLYRELSTVHALIGIFILGAVHFFIPAVDFVFAPLFLLYVSSTWIYLLLDRFFNAKYYEEIKAPEIRIKKVEVPEDRLD